MIDSSHIPAWLDDEVSKLLKTRGWSADTNEQLVAAVCEACKVVPIDPIHLTVDPSILDSYGNIKTLRIKKVLPFLWCSTTKTIHAMTSAPWDVASRDAVKASSLNPHEIVLYFADENFILSQIKARLVSDDGEKYDEGESQVENEMVETDTEGRGSSALWTDFSKLFVEATRCGANDIALQPDGSRFLLRAKIHGEMQELKIYNHESGLNLMMLLCSKGNIQQQNLLSCQSGYMQMKMEDGSRVDIRLESIPVHSTTGKTVCRLALRIQDYDLIKKIRLETVFDKDGEDYRDIMAAIRSPGTVSIISGPTGCGKTRTLGACLLELNTPNRNIFTVEDAVELFLEGIQNIRVTNVVTWADALRSLLRQAPDVIMVGEIRDSENATLVCNAAMTGHVVLTTLHTASCADIPERLCLGLGLNPTQASSALKLASSQRLIPQLCSCKLSDELNEKELVMRGLPKSLIGRPVYRRRVGGCNGCHNLGVTGRKAIIEILNLDFEMKGLITQQRWHDFRMEALQRLGERTLQYQGMKMLLEGKTDVEGLCRAMSFGDELKHLGIE